MSACRSPQQSVTDLQIRQTHTVYMVVHWVPKKLMRRGRTLDGHMSLSMCPRMLNSKKHKLLTLCQIIILSTEPLGLLLLLFFLGTGVAPDGAALEAEWNAKFAEYEKKYSEEAAELKSIISGELPAGWEKALPVSKLTFYLVCFSSFLNTKTSVDMFCQEFYGIRLHILPTSLFSILPGFIKTL